MRIAISGTSNIGKTSLKKQFLDRYKLFKTPDTNYKHLINALYLKNQKEERETNSKDIQWNVLNYMVEEFQKYKRDDKVLFEGCPLDNVIYTLYIVEKIGPQMSGIDENFLNVTRDLVKESMKYIDIVFYIPITKQDEKDREFDEVDIEINNLYEALHHQYLKNTCPYLPKDDQPAIIEIFGSDEERMKMIGLYIDEEGDVINSSSISDLIDPDMAALEDQVSRE